MRLKNPLTLHFRARTAKADLGAERTKTFLQPEGISMKVLLIDDHPLIVSALGAVIQGMGSGVVVVSAASAAQARETLAADASFDLALLDLQLGDSDGFAFLSELRAAYPQVPIVIVSASDRSVDVLRAIGHGAMGFVPKRASNETLFEALRMVISGGIYVPPMIMRSAPAAGGSRGAGEGWSGGSWSVEMSESMASTSSKPRPPFAELGLTPRQTDVLALLLQGKPNKLIARALNLSVETVKDHVAAVLRALNVSSRTQAVLAVSQLTNQGALAAWREARSGSPRHG